jgi:hypothetical protein
VGLEGLDGLEETNIGLECNGRDVASPSSGIWIELGHLSFSEDIVQTTRVDISRA